MQTFGNQNFNDPKVEQQRQAELVKLGRVVETKRNELADLTQLRDETLDRLHQVKAQIDKQQSLNMLLQHTRDLKEQHTRAATAQLESNVYSYHRDMSEQIELRTSVENDTAQQYESLAGELRLQWLCQSKANEATKRQIEAHGKKLDIMRAQHDEACSILESVKINNGTAAAAARFHHN